MKGKVTKKMKTYVVHPGFTKPTERIPKLKEAIMSSKPAIEAERAMLVTESYQQTESEAVVLRHAKAFAHVLENLPIVIRDNELIVGQIKGFEGLGHEFLIDKVALEIMGILVAVGVAELFHQLGGSIAQMQRDGSDLVGSGGFQGTCNRHIGAVALG